MARQGNARQAWQGEVRPGLYGSAWLAWSGSAYQVAPRPGISGRDSAGEDWRVPFWSGTAGKDWRGGGGRDGEAMQAWGGDARYVRVWPGAVREARQARRGEACQCVVGCGADGEAGKVGPGEVWRVRGWSGPVRMARQAGSVQARLSMAGGGQARLGRLGVSH
jgi:hypothetical protein